MGAGEDVGSARETWGGGDLDDDEEDASVRRDVRTIDDVGRGRFGGGGWFEKDAASEGVPL
jgi:hypothetical protein